MGRQKRKMNGPQREAARGAGKSVLIVDDNGDDIVLLQMALRAAGLDVETATAGDGEKAIQYLNQRLVAGQAFPSLVFLDLKMPNMSGWDVLRWLATQQGMRSMPVVVLTGSIRQEDHAEAVAQGAKEYWIKPHAFSDFVALVRNNFERWLRGHLALRDPKETGCR